MILTLGRDLNGNKILKASFRDGSHPFAVQTNGNLPATHRMTNDDFDEHTASGELNAYIKEYGTNRQKELLGC